MRDYNEKLACYCRVLLAQNQKGLTARELVDNLVQLNNLGIRNSNLTVRNVSNILCKKNYFLKKEGYAPYKYVLKKY